MPKGTRKVAEAYLNFLYTPEALQLIAHNYYRPSDPKSADPKDLARFPDLKLVSIDDPLFGGWAKAQPTHFGEAAISTRPISRSRRTELTHGRKQRPRAETADAPSQASG